MNTLIIDISETCLRAVLSNDGQLEFCRRFDFIPKALSPGEAAGHGQQSVIISSADDNSSQVYYDADDKRNPWELALKEIVKRIRLDINRKIDATHLILPVADVVITPHQLPRMPRQDAEKVIGRKIKDETKEEFPPFSIIPASSDQKTQTWFSLYVPSSTLQEYRKTFAANRLRLSSITTPINAMIDAFQGVREAIFNSYAVFEIQRGVIEAYYITADGMLLFQSLPYSYTENVAEGSSEENEKTNKFRLFKIIDTIFRINSSYQTSYPQIPVQMAWVCGMEKGLDDIAAALKEAMGLEVGIAPAIPTALQDENGYVPLVGFASALQNGTATVYSVADFLKRFPLRRTSGMIIFAVTGVLALLVMAQTERAYRKLDKQVKQLQQSNNSSQNRAKATASAAYSKNLDSLKKLTAGQFVFYNLFRELANGLPEDAYLEDLEYHLKDDKGVLEITTVARLSDKIGESMLLSKLMMMFDKSAILRKRQEPSITVVPKENGRYLRITVTSEVNLLDKTK
ncbi:MAG: hypothetical protein GJV46_02075 [Geobacter sp.]|nr:hypothetical protein [Geobacter sp.]